MSDQYLLKYNPRKCFSTNYYCYYQYITFSIIIIIIMIHLNLSTTANLGTEESDEVERWPLWGGGGVI